MKGIVKGLVGFLLRSLFTSFLMFIMVISLVSGKFPPDLMDVRKTFSALQELTQVGQQLNQQFKMTLQQQRQLQEQGPRANSDKLLHPAVVLREVNAEIAADERGSPKPNANQNAGPSGVGPGSSVEINSLKTKVSELESQLFRIQNRLGKLESTSR
ncbi:MAG: hypothetical protein JNM39_14015 [Bdellovibrionaceae bacterium]|nr:hypothetical protein [Pseudobdellovibrionaceae bacterium]